MTPTGLYIGDCVDVMKSWPEKSIHCCVTSPPYWGLRSYLPKDHADKHREIGSEATLDEWVQTMVGVFGEVRRVLRDDGTLWVNLGDSYGDDTKWGGSTGGKHVERLHGNTGVGRRKVRSGLPPGNLLGQPWRLAFALQADGWILRSAIVWAKGASFSDKWHGSVMPESASGWRWGRCRMKVKEQSGRACPRDTERYGGDIGWDSDTHPTSRVPAQWSPCPGCKKCSPHDGYVLRKGSGRPTSAFEMMFLFAKTRDYYYDTDAVREAFGTEPSENYPARAHITGRGQQGFAEARGNDQDKSGGFPPAEGGRNLRNVWAIGDDEWNEFRAWQQAKHDRDVTDVWAIGTKGYSGAHFAVFPEALVKPCIEAGTSERGCCPECGAPYARVLETKRLTRERPNDRTSRHEAGNDVNSCGNTVTGVETTTLGWRPTCECDAGDPIPCTVLDPFAGSGTTLAVAAKLGRNRVGIELNPDYKRLIRQRLGLFA